METRISNTTSATIDEFVEEELAVNPDPYFPEVNNLCIDLKQLLTHGIQSQPFQPDLTTFIAGFIKVCWTEMRKL